MIKIFYLLILATPSFVCSQTLLSGAHHRAGSFFEFRPEVTAVHSNTATPPGLELAEFTAKVLNREMVLEWTMAKETGNRHFIIERSLDGHSFDIVGEMDAVTIAGYTDYSFADNGILHSITYYRLKQTDAQGKSIYSKTFSVSLTREKPLQKAALQNSNKGTLNNGLSD